MSEKRPLETATPRSIEEQELMASTCCCCIPLKVACFVLGYLTLLTNLFNSLVVVGALIVFIVMTQDLEITHTRVTDSGQVADMDPVQQANLYYVLMVTGVLLLLNVVWTCWNVFMLVGLHKKRPGPIKLHMTVASFRFVLLVLVLLTSNGTSNSIDYIIMMCTEISVTGYFLVVYHAYATRLDRSQKAKILTLQTTNHTTNPPEISITDVYFAYPKVLDKQHLVEKEKY